MSAHPAWCACKACYGRRRSLSPRVRRLRGTPPDYAAMGDLGPLADASPPEVEHDEGAAKYDGVLADLREELALTRWESAEARRYGARWKALCRVLRERVAGHRLVIERLRAEEGTKP